MFGRITFLIAVLIIIFNLCVVFTISKSCKKCIETICVFKPILLAKGILREESVIINFFYAQQILRE